MRCAERLLPSITFVNGMQSFGHRLICCVVTAIEGLMLAANNEKRITAQAIEEQA